MKNIEIMRHHWWRNWVFPFWSEFEIVKLVKGNRDHEYDFTRIVIRLQLVTTGSYK